MSKLLERLYIRLQPVVLLGQNAHYQTLLHVANITKDVFNFHWTCMHAYNYNYKMFWIMTKSLWIDWLKCSTMSAEYINQTNISISTQYTVPFICSGWCVQGFTLFRHRPCTLAMLAFQATSRAIYIHVIEKSKIQIIYNILLNLLDLA